MRDRSRWTAFWVPFLLFSALASLWALASPILSVPDENAHATKAVAQLRGQVIGEVVPGVKHLVVQLPDGYRYSPQIVCFAMAPDVTADCGVELGTSTGTNQFNTWVGAYNPVYYYVVGWPSLIFDGSAGIYAMRIASSLFCAMFFAWAWQAGMAARRARWMPAGLAFAAVPMALYLAGSVNPNGVEIASAAALWVSVLRLLQTFGRDEDPDPFALPRPYLWSIVTLSSIVLVNARSLGPLWLFIVVGLCFVASGWDPVKALFTRGSSYGWLAAIVAGGIFSVAWTLGGGALSSQAEASDASLVGGSFAQGFFHTLRYTPDYLKEAFITFGWLDTQLAPEIGWSVVAAFSVLVVLSVVAVDRRSVLVLCAILVACLLVPALVQGYSVHQTGIIWQGRYGLFLYLGIPFLGAWLLSRNGRAVVFISVRVTWIIAVLMGTFGVGAYLFVLHRYVAGFDTVLGALWNAAKWQPPLGWLALTVAFSLISLVYIAWTGLTAHVLARREDDILSEVRTSPELSTDARDYA
ncbi:DUF2142 domain-containing protein [Luethyella okanaganae]|uniref:DUF2142 domain-containing protein n=1 Tax=Luethyella okanaganae TaxID=69372 RepID=A0ABW1VBJ9_9MICO